MFQDKINDFREVTAMKKTKALWADLLLLLAAAIWGGGFVAGKMALEGMSPLAVLLYRFLMSVLVMGLLFFPKICRATKDEVKFGCLLGTMSFTALTIQLAALQYTTSAKQSFIAAAYVVFTPLLSWLLFKARPAAREMLAALITLLGVGFISLSGGLNIQIGDPISVGFTVVFALQIIIIGRYTRGLSPINLAFFQLLSALVLSAAAVVIMRVPLRVGDPSFWGAVFYLGPINTAFAMVLQNTAQKHTKENHAALLMSLESVFGFIFSVLIFHDPVNLRILLGCGLIMAGVLLSKLRRET